MTKETEFHQPAGNLTNNLTDTKPFETKIGFSVPLKSKEDDFIGKNTLIKKIRKRC